MLEPVTWTPKPADLVVLSESLNAACPGIESVQSWEFTAAPHIHEDCVMIVARVKVLGFDDLLAKGAGVDVRMARNHKDREQAMRSAGWKIGELCAMAIANRRGLQA